MGIGDWGLGCLKNQLLDMLLIIYAVPLKSAHFFHDLVLKAIHTFVICYHNAIPPCLRKKEWIVSVIYIFTILAKSRSFVSLAMIVKDPFPCLSRI